MTRERIINELITRRGYKREDFKHWSIKMLREFYSFCFGEVLSDKS